MERHHGEDNRIVTFAAAAYLFLMTTIFPLYTENGYRGLGEAKYRFFFWCTLGALALGGIGGLIFVLRKATRNNHTQSLPRFSITDCCVGLYLAGNGISWLLTEYKPEAWNGADGWSMGLKTQLLLGGVYVLISRGWPREKKVQTFLLSGFCVGCGGAWLLGLLHRFGVDPLHFYDGLKPEVQLRFLSTVGQATWYSSFLMVTLPVALCLFLFSEQLWMRIGFGLLSALSFMTLVTQNSDSAFVGLAALTLGLFWYGLRDRCRMFAFCEFLYLLGASFAVTGLLQAIVGDAAAPVGELSQTLTCSPIGGLLAVTGVMFRIWLEKLPEEKWLSEKTVSTVRRVLLSIAVLGITAAGVVAAVAVAGGRMSDSWGNYRGFIWRMGAQILGKMNLRQRLFGVGPDAFWIHAYRYPETGDVIRQIFGNSQLVNVHNEYLQLWICIGPFGLVAWVLMIASGVRNSFRLAEKKPMVLFVGLGLLMEAAHNIFCYQQICCTPYVFILLGIAAAMERYRNECTIL